MTNQIKTSGPVHASSKVKFIKRLQESGPQERIFGSHLKKMATRFNLKSIAMCHVLGVTYATLMRMNKTSVDDADQLQPRHSIFVRYLLNNPKQAPIAQYPSPLEYLAALQEIDPGIKLDHAALIIGLNNTSFRVYDPEYSPSPVVSSYMKFILDILDGCESQQAKMKALVKFAQNAQDEAQSRGIGAEEFWGELRWPVIDRGSTSKS